jgi:microcystin-dependent protein
MVAVFVALGGVGAAQTAVNAAQGQYGKKVTICHKGKKTITVGKAAVPAHLRHGDAIGTCASVRAKKAKAAKIKAAKIKAAKAKAEKTKAEKSKAEEKSQKPAEGEKPGKGKGRGK